MTYSEIFAEIVSIMGKDSATYPDYGAGDYEKYKGLIRDDMEKMDFLHVVRDYLATFKVNGHLRLDNSNIGGVGFSVMRNGDKLFVTSANKETGLVPGDEITAIDSMLVPEVAEKEKNMLMGESKEREGGLWSAFLPFYKSVTVSHADGSTEEITLKLGTKSEPTESYEQRKIDDNTFYMRFNDFADEEAITKLYEDCRQDLDSCKNLIVDVRGNIGGADTAFYPLIEYCFPADKPAQKYIVRKYPVEVNYSERNCKDRLEIIKKFFGENIPEEIKPMVEKMISDVKENMGKGFVEDSEEIAAGVTGRKMPEKVFIITDEDCGSTGDAFVETMSFSPKVTVVGRPTAGALDYSNCSMVQFDDFTLVYPTSRDSRISHGEGMSQKGVPVDVYIPWKPENFGKDVEFKYVLEQIKA